MIGFRVGDANALRVGTYAARTLTRSSPQRVADSHPRPRRGDRPSLVALGQGSADRFTPSTARSGDGVTTGSPLYHDATAPSERL